jgi:hypothetical protein
MRTIRQWVSASCIAVALAVGVPLFVASVDAQARPKNATAQCKDDTYSSAKTKQGACSKHGGVKTWFADEKGAPPAAPTTPKASPTATSKTGAAAAATASIPANATAQCTDGTYSTAKTKQGACSKHGGVKTWFADEKAATGATPPSTKTAATPAATPKTAASAPKTTTAPAGTPDNATAKCKDGTYSFAKQHSGACSHHGGVAEWYK